MNYVKLFIGGAERGAKLGIGFLEKVMKGEDISLQTLFSKIEVEAFTFLPKLLFYALAYNCERAGEKVDFNLGDVFDWTDEIGINSEEYMKFQVAFYNSIKTHLPQEAQESINAAVKEIEGKMKPQTKSGKTGK